LKVCFEGNETQRNDLRNATEKAFNADISVDDGGCVTGLTARSGKGFGDLQKSFQGMVADKNTFYVEFGSGDRVSHFDPDTRTATINPLDIDRKRYISGGFLGCFFLGGSGTAKFSTPSILVHELIGHGSGMVGGGKPYQSGIWAENEYHNAVGEPQRCFENR